jgi:hypothetical protein
MHPVRSGQSSGQEARQRKESHMYIGIGTLLIIIILLIILL